MKTTFNPQESVPLRVGQAVVVGWFVIVAKCMAMPWIFERWQIPVHSAWVIAPTLFFAALVTLIVLAHDWTGEDET